MKKFSLFLILLFTFIGIKNVYAFDNSIKVYDYAQELSSSEEDKLKEKTLEYIEKYNMDMVLVTVKHHEKKDTKSYAEDFYDYNNFGLGSTNDGIIFVIDFTFGYTDIYISTTGEAIRMYDDSRINNMLDDIANKKDSGYYKMFEVFIKDSSNYASMGIPSSNKNVVIDSNGNPVYKKSIPWFLIIIIDSIITFIVMLILINKNKMIKKSVNANYYLNDNSLMINQKIDKFITTHTSSVRINSDSSSGSGHVGGSSVSRGSSGISHGGGGRRL